MKKLTVQEISKELVNKEMSFTELDLFMVVSGYQSIFYDGVAKVIKDNLNVIYTAPDTCECEVQISFEITINNAEGFMEEDFYLKVINVSRY